MIPVRDVMKHNLLAAIRQILRPVIRIALRNDVMFGDFTNEVRAAYVEVARELARVHGREPTDMRLRLMTGLPSSDVNWAHRVNEERASAPEVPGQDSHTVAATVLSAWHSEPDYSQLYGIPTELPLVAANDHVSFTDLVKRVDPTANAELIVERLIDAGCIREVAPKRYQVQSRVYMAAELSSEGLRYLAETTERFITTLSNNLTGGSGGEKRLERAVFADHGIPESRLREFQEAVKARWEDFANPLDNWLNAPVPRGESDDEPVVQTGVGIYHYVFREPAESDSTVTVGVREGTNDEFKLS
jgi:hypothetical protein